MSHESTKQPVSELLTETEAILAKHCGPTFAHNLTAQLRAALREPVTEQSARVCEMVGCGRPENDILHTDTETRRYSTHEANDYHAFVTSAATTDSEPARLNAVEDELTDDEIAERVERLYPGKDGEPSDEQQLASEIVATLRDEWALNIAPQAEAPMRACLAAMLARLSSRSGAPTLDDVWDAVNQTLAEDGLLPGFCSRIATEVRNKLESTSLSASTPGVEQVFEND